MTIRTSTAVGAAFALAFALNCQAAESYAISASLLHNGKSFGEPSAIVNGNTLTLVEVSGPNGYRLSFIVTDIAEDKIEVAAKLHSPHGDIDPVVVVRPGQPATVTVGELGLTLTVQRSGS